MLGEVAMFRSLKTLETPTLKPDTPAPGFSLFGWLHDLELGAQDWVRVPEYSHGVIDLSVASVALGLLRLDLCGDFTVNEPMSQSIKK